MRLFFMVPKEQCSTILWLTAQELRDAPDGGAEVLKERHIDVEQQAVVFTELYRHGPPLDEEDEDESLVVSKELFTDVASRRHGRPLVSGPSRDDETMLIKNGDGDGGGGGDRWREMEVEMEMEGDGGRWRVKVFRVFDPDVLELSGLLVVLTQKFDSDNKNIKSTTFNTDTNTEL
ncbi:hypothetical protein EYF80_053130 [Liparis tanakae]|uniref:Uncharacterized protein n=1 Tax=Liparis tanakae TaxID=230148 RepID=A0A4Z2F6L5_9TELE|nr:hypothetical protein EYF80_053130 [Liparis tanakae]